MLAFLFLLVVWHPRFAHAADDIAPDLVRRVELQWEAEQKAISYEVQLATNPEFQNPLYSETIKDTHFTVDVLPGAYFYRVRSIDDRGRPGQWTAIQELNINARPPILLYPLENQVLDGNLPDTGIPMEWRSSGPGIKYLLEIKAADEKGQYNETIVRQEVDDTTFPFFPQKLGKYQWTVNTLGASGAEQGVAREFSVLGSLTPKGERKLRYVSPWWRNHWTLYSRYGQTSSGYSMQDQELGAKGSFSAITGFLEESLGWEWHDPVTWLYNGVPWFQGEFRLDRQTVLTESVVLPRKSVSAGAWYAFMEERLRLSPILEYGVREVPIYQPRSDHEALRTNSARNHIGLGAQGEFQVMPFIFAGLGMQLNFESGGLGGLQTINGDQLDPLNRYGILKPYTGKSIFANGTMLLGARMKVQARFNYENTGASWTPRFYAQRKATSPPIGDTEFSQSDLSFDVAFGIKF